MERSSPKRTKADSNLPSIVGTGLVALDVLLQSDHSGLGSALGGSAGNVLSILAYLGWRSVPVGELGCDHAGSQIRSEFEALQADTRFLVQEPGHSTPVVYQWPGGDEKSHKFSFACPFCGRKRGFCAPDHDALGVRVLHNVESSDVFYFDRVTPIALRLAEEYRSRGALVVFEPSSVSDDSVGYRRALQHTHVLKYADDRIAELSSYDLGNVLVEIQTRGSQGLRFRAPSLVTEWVNSPSITVPTIVDTAGAGDWCTAGMLYMLFHYGRIAPDQLTYNRLFEALRFGQALAALNCMHRGARGITKQCSSSRLKRAAGSLQKSSRVSDWNLKLDSPRSSGEILKCFSAGHRNKRTQESQSRERYRLCCEPI